MNLDKNIIKDLKSNDENKIRYAFNCVYNQYFKLVYFCISQYVKNKEDVEELTNDTFVIFFNNISSLKIEKNLKYYILVIAKNNAISFLRKNNNKYAIMPDDMLKNIPYDEHYQSTDIIDRLKTILNKEELIIVLNHLLYNDSFKEIADDLKLSVNTVSSKYQRAIKKANKMLNKGMFI